MDHGAPPPLGSPVAVIVILGLRVEGGVYPLAFASVEVPACSVGTAGGDLEEWPLPPGEVTVLPCSRSLRMVVTEYPH